MKRMNSLHHPELKTMHLGRVHLDWSVHAADRAHDKGVHTLGSLNVQVGTIVELEAEGTKVTKLVVRVSQCSMNDAVYVIVPMSRTLWKVVTAWTNHVNDTHSTLNKERISA